jgi:hypothetical protein
MTTFAAPAAGGDKLALADINNHAVIIRPVSYEQSIPTTYGDSDAIKVDVVDLTTGLFHEGVLWFSGMVIGALKSRIGELVLAQVTQGTAKPGQSPPWVLASMVDNEQVVAAANAWLAANPGKLTAALAAPATPAAAPAPQVAAPLL